MNWFLFWRVKSLMSALQRMAWWRAASCGTDSCSALLHRTTPESERIVSLDAND